MRHSNSSKFSVSSSLLERSQRHAMPLQPLLRDHRHPPPQHQRPKELPPCDRLLGLLCRPPELQLQPPPPAMLDSPHTPGNAIAGGMGEGAASIAPKAAEATAAAAARAASSPACNQRTNETASPFICPSFTRGRTHTAATDGLPMGSQNRANEGVPRALQRLQVPFASRHVGDGNVLFRLRELEADHDACRWHSGRARVHAGWRNIGNLQLDCAVPVRLGQVGHAARSLQPVPKYSSAIEFIRRRFRSSGIRGFYHGIGAQLTRSFPVHSLNFLVYEQVLAWCKRA
ncbi:hypothetical protein DFJ73DRAFT_243434 [Zopfochytrium polystomum]|nr:hypothetical protein DFJ73DRAFT_243434 [Zopfochytrium polystomum]